MTEPLSENRAYCACLELHYDPTDMGGGAVREHWSCSACNAAFVRVERLDKANERIAELRTSLQGMDEIARQNANSADSAHQDWAILREEVQEHVEAIAELKESEAYYREEIERRDAWLELHGYRRCDIPACNCNGWHGGERSAEARLREIYDALGGCNGTLPVDEIARWREALRLAGEALRRIKEDGDNDGMAAWSPSFCVELEEQAVQALAHPAMKAVMDSPPSSPTDP